MDSQHTIAVIGIWHLGEVYSACLSSLGHTVIGFSEDKNVVLNLQKGIPPLAEPGLEEVLKSNQQAGRLSYSDDFSKIGACDVVWITYDTPVDDEDVADLDIIFRTLEEITPHLKDDVTVAVSSQLPVGTSKRICEAIREKRPELKFSYFYSPENLRLGSAVQGFMRPGRIVVGSDETKALQTAKSLFGPLGVEILEMKTVSAEMAKHALNAWLAMSISYTNDLADLCERVGADIEDIIRALKTDPRVGEKTYLFAGLGFSGGTLGRDLQALISSAKKEGVELPVISGVYEKNKTRSRIVQRRLEAEFREIGGRTLAIFGVTYKPGTSTLRRSQPLGIESDLRAAGALIKLYDPLAVPEEVAEETPSPFYRDPYEAASGADAILVLSPDPKFKDLDFERLVSVMKTPVFFDAQNILISVESGIRSAGFKYISIGR